MLRKSQALLFLAFAAMLLLIPGQAARATGEGCGLFNPCAHSHDYCRFVDIFTSVCTTRGSSGQSCTGVGQGTCADGLVCDVIGECRHSPPRAGEPCGLGVPCASGLICSADIGGRCQAPGGVGDACSGVGQGSCASGLVCDANRTCRHDPPELGEPCGVGVPCAGDLVCSAVAGGVCQNRGLSGDACIGIGQGTCADGLVCDVIGECRHEPPRLGEPCGLGVPCAPEFGCSAEIGGRCEERDAAGEVCSGIGQGSCQAGLVCDALRICRHDPPRIDEPCGLGVPCASGLFCQPGTQRCKRAKTVGEGCSAFNQCLPGLSCDPCLIDGCNFPLQCFPNPNQGAITRQQCLALYSPALHQAARDLGLAMTWGGGDGITGVVSESQEFGVVYGPDGRFGCFTTLCGGLDLDAEVVAFVSVGFYDDFDVVAGSSTAFVEEAEILGVVNFSTSQIFERFSLDPFDIGTLIGTEDCVSIGVSAVPFPLSAGVYECESVVDTVMGGVGFCGDGTLDSGEGCDDGNRVGGDGCSASCTVEATCGNGALDPGEGCDDGNAIGGDGCASNCTVESFCGDGNLDLGEGCDDGANQDGDGCSAFCTLEDNDGDGVLDELDNCATVANPPLEGRVAQADADGDGIGDACECGDFNLDGRVNTTDARLAQLCSIGRIPCAGLCDASGDGLCNTTDARLIQRHAAGAVTKDGLSCPQRP